MTFSLEAGPSYMLRYGFTQLRAVFDRMQEMKGGNDPRPRDFIEPIPGVLKGVSVNAVGERQAINDDVYFWGSKETFHHMRHSR